MAAVASVLQAAATWTDGDTGTVAFFVVNDDTSSAVYQHVEAVAGDIFLTELTMMVTIDAEIVVGALLFAACYALKMTRIVPTNATLVCPS